MARENFVSIRFTNEEMEIIQRRSREQGYQSRSKYIRDSVLSQTTGYRPIIHLKNDLMRYQQCIERLVYLADQIYLSHGNRDQYLQEELRKFAQDIAPLLTQYRAVLDQLSDRH